jgi:hypothetical protein
MCLTAQGNKNPAEKGSAISGQQRNLSPDNAGEEITQNTIYAPHYLG